MSLGFLSLGGDKRQIYTGDALKRHGHSVSFSGLGIYDNFSYDDYYEYIILPAPYTRDGKTIFSPLAEDEVPVEEILNFRPPKGIFSGACANLREKLNLKDSIKIYDLLLNEDYNILNAVATAEAALSIAIKNTSFNISGSETLVVGFGKIGKVLAKNLKGIGAKVTVAARKSSDRAYSKNLNYEAISTDEISDDAVKYKIIFNTAPKLLIDEDIIKSLSHDCLIIDLASIPGGVDFEACDKYKIKVLHALGLPGKYSPRTSGEITAEIILNLKDGKS